MARVLIGTSGWHYDSWRGPFFPKGLPLQSQLQFYASQFPTAELNGVFYRTPTPEAVKSWRDQTGKDFVFAWKASKFITHWKRLSENSVNSLELLEDRLSLLGSKVGPILFQLPPNFKADADRLGKFFKMLPNKRRYSFEFRDPSWYAPRILKMLAEQNISLCLSDHHDAPRALEANGGLCLHSGARSRRPLQRSLPGEHADGMGQTNSLLEETRQRCLRLF
jgi:uncharacterized protein YecE (DUF72 family)